MKYTTYKGKFRYTPGVNAYDVTVRKPFNWLWLLLLLLLLPLFIRCEREVVVEVLDEKGTPVENVDISLAYDARFLYNDGFFYNRAGKGRRPYRGWRHGQDRQAAVQCVELYIFHRD